LLKSKGYLKQTSASAGKIYQPKVTHVNVKIPAEELSIKDKHQKVHSVEASSSKSEVKLEVLEEVAPKVKSNDPKSENIHTIPISLIDTFTSESKESFSIPNIICTQPILSLPEVKVYVSKNPEDHFLLSRSSRITSPTYPSSPSERLGSSPHFPPHLDFSSLSRDLSPYDFLAELRSHLPEAIKGLVHQSFEIFDNLQYSPRISSPRVSMVGVGGAEVEGLVDMEMYQYLLQEFLPKLLLDMLL
jgi:hypothetical protein